MTIPNDEPLTHSVETPQGEFTSHETFVAVLTHLLVFSFLPIESEDQTTTNQQVRKSEILAGLECVQVASLSSDDNGNGIVHLERSARHHDASRDAFTLQDQSSSATVVAIVSPSFDSPETAYVGLASPALEREAEQISSSISSPTNSTSGNNTKEDTRMKRFLKTLKSAFMHPQEETTRKTCTTSAMMSTDPIPKNSPTSQIQPMPRQIVTLNELSYADPSNEQAQVVVEAYGDFSIPTSSDINIEEQRCSEAASSSSSPWKKRLSFKIKAKDRIKIDKDRAGGANSVEEVSSPANQAAEACMRYCSVIAPQTRVASSH